MIVIYAIFALLILTFLVLGIGSVLTWRAKKAPVVTEVSSASVFGGGEKDDNISLASKTADPNLNAGKPVIQKAADVIGDMKPMSPERVFAALDDDEFKF